MTKRQAFKIRSRFASVVEMLRLLMLLSLALRFTTAVATEDKNFIPSPEGYYEGLQLQLSSWPSD